jgi:hypothetical protein
MFDLLRRRPMAPARREFGARETAALASALAACHMLAPMAGSPLKRHCKFGLRQADGSVIAFPYMPRVGG